MYSVMVSFSWNGFGSVDALEPSASGIYRFVRSYLCFRFAAGLVFLLSIPLELCSFRFGDLEFAGILETPSWFERSKDLCGAVWRRDAGRAVLCFRWFKLR